MPASFPSSHRGHPERLAAWIVTGPLGHLWSAVADLALYALRYAARRVHGLLRAQRNVAGAGNRESERR